MEDKEQSPLQYSQFESCPPGDVGNGSALDKKTTLWRSLRKWPKVFCYCCILTPGLLLFGFDFAVAGNLSGVPAFRRDYGYELHQQYIIPAEWLGLWSAIGPIGSMAGSIFAGWFQARVGRRPAIAFGSLLSTAGVAVVFASQYCDQIEQRRVTFLLGKLILGLAIGDILCATQTYMSEILSQELRGPLMSFFPAFILLGQLLGGIAVKLSLSLPGSRSYTIPIVVQWPLSTATLLASFVLPESPTHLLRKRNRNGAFKAQRRLDSESSSTQTTIENIIQSLRDEQQAEHQHSTYIECFRYTNRRRTMIVIFAYSIPQLFGLSLLGSGSYFVQLLGLPAETALTVLILAVFLGLLSNLASMWVMTKVDRRMLGLTTLCISCILWLVMGVVACSHNDAIIAKLSAAIFVLEIMVVGIGIWPVSYAVGAETSSLRLRSRTQGIGWLFNGLGQGVFGISLPYVYNPGEGDLKAKVAFIFVGTCAMACAIFWRYVPEMKDRSAKEIDAMFQARLSATQFKAWRPESPNGPAVQA